ncbi:MAG: hypothetical protein ACUZ9M_09360 [Candidatus Scalindua sp.]
MVKKEGDNMRAEYNFKGGVRGKHYRAMQNGYTITIHKENGKSVVKEVTPKEGVVVLDSDIRPYFSNSESVNKALRCLIPLLPKKRRAKANKT